MNKTGNTIPGKLIVIEGIDGCGKTTLANGLAAKLRDTKHEPLLTKEPGQTAIGSQLRTLLLDTKKFIVPKTVYLLFAANRAQHIEEVIIPELEKGTLIISDRMADSSLAYQGYGYGLDIDMIQSINAWCMNNIVPHLVIYLRISPAEARERIHTRNLDLTSIEQESEDFWQRVHDGYEHIFANRDNVLTLDATHDPDTLIEMAYSYITKHVL